MAQRISQHSTKKLTIVLLGKQAHFKNYIANSILDRNAFSTVLNNCSKEENEAFKIINTPDIFSEECPNPDQQIIDCMALSHPGPNLFIVVMGSENTQEHEVTAQISEMKRMLGDAITTNLVIMFQDKQSLQKVRHLEKQFGMMVPDEDLIRKWWQWCTSNAPYMYTYDKYSEEVITARKNVLSKRRCEPHPDNHSTAVVVHTLPLHGANKPAETAAQPPENHYDEIMPQSSTVCRNEKTYKTFTIALLGQSGTGKSASANTILKAAKSPPALFTSVSSSMPVTTECEVRVVMKLFGSEVRIIDTPDFFHDELDVPQREIERLKAFCFQGTCVYLVVLQLGRYTEDERRMVERLEQKLGLMIRDNAIVLLTHGEDLKGQDLCYYVNQQPNLRQMIGLCGDRCHVFSNKTKDSKQVMKLIKKFPYYPTYFPKLKDKYSPHECCLC